MKKVRKRIWSVLLAVAMIASMTVAALADDKSETNSMIGVGTYANPVNADVWEIEFPTAESASFTIDPLKLVYLSNRYEDEYGAEVNSSATILFPTLNEDGDPTAFSSSSGEIKVVNRGTKDITVELNIRPTDTPMVIKDNNTFSGDTQPSLYFEAFNSGGTPQVVGAVGATFSADVDKADAWATEWDGENYVYYEDEEKTGADGFTWNAAAFHLSGAANTNSGVKWDDENLTAPNLKLTWTVRNKNADAIALDLSAVSGTSVTDYTIAADCIKAMPGQTVNVYVKPTPAAVGSSFQNVIATGPSKIKTATKNYYTNEISEIEEDTFCSFSNGISSDNGTMVYTFMVPTASGHQGFSTKATSGSNLVDNTIAITGAPTVTTLTFSTALGTDTPDP